jgi:hypothetical protein
MKNTVCAAGSIVVVVVAVFALVLCCGRNPQEWFAHRGGVPGPEKETVAERAGGSESKPKPDLAGRVKKRLAAEWRKIKGRLKSKPGESGKAEPAEAGGGGG